MRKPTWARHARRLEVPSDHLIRLGVEMYQLRKRFAVKRHWLLAGCVAGVCAALAGSATPALGSHAGNQRMGAASACGGPGTTLAVTWPNLSVTPAVLVLLHQAQKDGKALGWKVLLNDPGTALSKQVSTVKTWIQEKVSAIMAVTLSTQVFEGLAKQATSAGVKWINYGSALKGQSSEITYRQANDGMKLGRYAGQWVNKNLGGQAQVALLTYQAGDWSRARISGVVQGLHQVAPKAEIVAKQDALSLSQGLSKTKTILQGHPGVNVILGVNDAAAEGAYKAWVAAGKGATNPKAFIGGLDGDILALQLVQKGNTVYRASVAIPLLKVGDAIISTTKQLLCGKQVPQWVSPTTLVTSATAAGRAQAAQFLKDQGAH
jgi:ribose transport system substrate-binding protein